MSARRRAKQQLSLSKGERRGHNPAQHLRPLQLITAIAALFALFAITASGASAAVPSHTYKEIFGATTTPPAFERAAGMAIDPATGDVYVIDLETLTLNRYKENGEPAPFSALAGSNVIDGISGEDKTPQEGILSTEGSSAEAAVAIAPASAGGTAGDIYVTDAQQGKIDIFSSAGKYLGQESFGYPCGVAVDSAGTVFVGSLENEAAVYKLEPTSTPGELHEVDKFPTTSSCQVAAGYGPASGSVFVAQFGGAISKLDASTGTKDFGFFTGTPSLVSDPATGHVYVPTVGEVKEFDVAGSAAQEVSSTVIPGEGVGIGVNPITGGFYVDETANPNVEVYDPIAKTLGVTINGSGEVKCKDLVAPGTFGPCAATYPEAHTIRLLAVAGSGSSFKGWSEFPGSGTTCTGAVAECEVNLAADVTGKATFLANPTASLKVTKSGTGSGPCRVFPAASTAGRYAKAPSRSGKQSPWKRLPLLALPSSNGPAAIPSQGPPAMSL